MTVKKRQEFVGGVKRPFNNMKVNNYDKIEKVVVNSGIGRQSQDANFESKILAEIISEFGQIVGQKPAPRPATKSLASFKLRAGTTVGLKATLRGARKNQFLSKVLNIVFPRVRDFRGIDEKGVDASGNLSFGFKEQLVFPEIVPENSKVSFGLQVTIVPKRIKDRAEAIEIYRALGVPFKKLVVSKNS